METLSRVLARLAALPPRLKFVAGAGLAFALGLLALGVFATRDTRVTLFATPLRADQLAEVESRLAAWRVPYAPLADNVRVEPRRRPDLLLRLGLAGIPHPHLAGSAEALAHVGALTPQSVLEAQTRDALAADLAQGLRGLDGVADARVIVAPGRGGIYADDPARDASASVRITLAPGARLAPATVAGIRAFVAGGVPGLDPQHVTVLDDRGVLDGADGADHDDGAIQSSLQSALDAAFGGGATIVRVHREPLGEQRESHDVRRVALPGALTRSTGDERYASEKKRYAKATATEEHGSETRDERHTAGPDATARLSVAIFVDVARALDLDKIRDLAEAAAGIDRRRGDALRVEAVRFSAPAAARCAVSTAGHSRAGGGQRAQVALVAAVVVLLVLGARPVYALAARVVEAAAVRAAAGASAGLPPARVRGALAGEPPHVAAAVISALPAATATAVLDLYPPEERAQIVRRLARAAVELVPPAEELLRGRG